MSYLIPARTNEGIPSTIILNESNKFYCERLQSI